MFHKLHTVDSVSTIERDVHVYSRLTILQLNNGYFRMLKGVYRLADPGLQKLISKLVDHAGFLDIGLIYQQVDIRVGKVETCRAGPENHYACVGIALSHYIFDSGHYLFA